MQCVSSCHCLVVVVVAEVALSMHLCDCGIARKKKKKVAAPERIGLYSRVLSLGYDQPKWVVPESWNHVIGTLAQIFYSKTPRFKGQ